MLTPAQSKWGSRLASLAGWALAAACLGYWGLKLGAAPAASAVPVVQSTSAPVLDSARLAALLGATSGATPAAPVVAASSRFALQGVIANAASTGAALIAVDGKPAKPYRVGAQVDTGFVLKAVGPRTAVLATSMTAADGFTLELPVNKVANVAAPGGLPGASPAFGSAPTRYQAPAVVGRPQAVPDRPPPPPPARSSNGLVQRVR